MTTPESLFSPADGTGVEGAARISECGQYRYWLTRRWSSDGPPVTFVMLNPSTADATTDDPTIRRCIGFARAWGYSAVSVVNLYAYRATDPRDLWRAPDPVGPQNDSYLTLATFPARSLAAPLIAAWGSHARPDRVDLVLSLDGFDRLQTLGFTQSGAPRHPLYVRADAERLTFPRQVAS